MAPPRLPRYRSRGLALGLALAGLAAGIRERPSVATKPPKPAPVERWIRTAATVRVDAPAAACYAAYSDLTRMPEWCPLLSKVTFDEETRASEWRMGYKGVSVGWKAQNLEESPPSLLRWESRAGAHNFGTAAFADAGEDACDLEVAITYKIPRVVADLVEGPRAQRFIRSLLARTLRAFSQTMAEEHERRPNGD